MSDRLDKNGVEVSIGSKVCWEEAGCNHVGTVTLIRDDAPYVEYGSGGKHGRRSFFACWQVEVVK